MSPVQVPASGRWPKRFSPGAARLLVLAVLALHGIGRAAEAAAPAVGQGPVAAAGTEWVLTGVSRDHGPVQGVASAARVPRPDAARVGGGECCKSPTCRCGCLTSVAAIAIAALGDGWRMPAP